MAHGTPLVAKNQFLMIPKTSRAKSQVCMRREQSITDVVETWYDSYF